MLITLVSATEREVQKTLHQIPLWKGFKNIEINHLVTGIGLVSTTYTLTKFLQKNKPDLMIQAGIAGCFDKQIPLGSTFIVKKECIADMGVMENKFWKDAGELGFVNADHIQFENSLLNSYLPEAKNLNIPIVNGISINEISTDVNFINSIIHRYHPMVESMEGAAFHYTCLLENISFLQLRSVSNYIGERDKTKWLIETSIENLNNHLIEYINHIIKSIS